jgi:hypothetical protein
MLWELAGVGDGVDASEKEEAVIAKEEGLLFFAEDGVGDFLGLEELGVGALAHGLQDIIGGGRRVARLHPAL